MRKYPSIPDPAKNIDSLYETVTALKRAVEQLTGQAGGIVPSHVFTVTKPPKEANVGDLWINQAGLWFWNGTEWQAVP